MSQGLKTHTHPEGGCVTQTNGFWEETLANTNAFKWETDKTQKKIRRLNGKALVVWALMELWMKTLPTAGVAVGHLLIFHIVARSISLLFLLVFLVFDGTIAGVSFFSAFCLRDSLQRNCDSVLIRSFLVTQWRASVGGPVCGRQQWN